MRYPKFRKQGLFAGSGVIEAGCKLRSDLGSSIRECLGTVRGTNAIIAFRAHASATKFEG